MAHIRQIISLKVQCGWRDGSVSNSAFCSFKKPKFISMHPDRELITTHKSSSKGSIAQL